VETVGAAVRTVAVAAAIATGKDSLPLSNQHLQSLQDSFFRAVLLLLIRLFPSGLAEFVGLDCRG